MRLPDQIASADALRSALISLGIEVCDIQERVFPGEKIYIVFVNDSYFDRAIQEANRLDERIEDGFITVKKSASSQQLERVSVSSVQDERITQLIELLNSRSRTSEQLPALRYVKDAEENLAITLSPRHHLIFGRRGVGKSALMVEARSLLQRKGALTTWMNFQPLRGLSSSRAFLTLLLRLCDLPRIQHQNRLRTPLSEVHASTLRERIQNTLAGAADVDLVAQGLVGDAQYMLRLLTDEVAQDLYLFFDDVHYMPSAELPVLLDMIHGLTRDNRVWIKAAGIKHQMRWFVDNPPTGLQTGHDATIINLDVTLENPRNARFFLSNIFQTYVEELRIKSISRVISASAIDRLVLASGGVPRDFLILSAAAMASTRARQGGRTAGVQDVNAVAGEAANLKLQELEEDAAASRGGARQRIDTLGRIRNFLISTRQITFFQIDFLDKERHPAEYDLVQGLMDLRMIHLLHASLSDRHEAGKRAEVYLIDLSQYSGSRFKQKLTVLDLESGTLVMRKTRTTELPRRGQVARDINAILRLGPVFDLSALSDLVG